MQVNCIITHVKLRGVGGGQLRLLPAEKKKIKDKLQTLKRGAIYYSDDVESDEEEEDESEDDEEEEDEEEEEEEKPKRTPKKKGVLTILPDLINKFQHKKW